MRAGARRLARMMAERRPDSSSLREMLTAQRASTLERIAGLSRDWDGIVESSTGMPIDDEHDPEGATIAFERSQIEALLDHEHQRLAELDQALERLREGSYGICERCGRRIATERLAARPAASTCITCAASR